MKFLVVVFLLFVSQVYARTYDLSNRLGIGGGGGTTYPLGQNEFNDNADDDYSYNFHIRYQSAKHDALQLNYTNLDFEDTDLRANVYDLMYLYRFNPVDRFTPVIGIGAGVADLNNVTQDNLKFQGRFRLGFEYMLTDDLMASLVVDYHYINKMPDDDTRLPYGEMNVLSPQLNLTLFFGHDKEEHEDRGKKAAAVAAPVAVSQIDTDKDGIVDAKDKCPSTPTGAEVNEYGCMKEEKAQVNIEVFFETGKAKIDLNSYDSMNSLADFLKEHPQTKAEIQGHTDSVGSAMKNRQLSADRANAVKVYLVEKQGISPTRLTSYGYGEDQPIADNSTKEGRAKNRRVMAVISE